MEFAISPGLAAKGDERLLRVVIDNLLRNAWKFTKKQPDARIEFGRMNGDISAYFVRDNGVGFDMAVRGQVVRGVSTAAFGAEFAGSGVGLAIVQRSHQPPRRKGLGGRQSELWSHDLFYLAIGTVAFLTNRLKSGSGLSL